MKRFFVKRPDGTLVGWDVNDQKFIDGLEIGECVEAETHKAREPKHHKLFFALFDDAYVNQDKYSNRTAFLIALKLKAGWYDEHVTADGKLVYVPRSISWARLDQDGFDKFYNEAVVALAEMAKSPQVTEKADEILARHS